MSKIKKILRTVYLIGGIGVYCLLVRMFLGGREIVNPEAMLPCNYIESSSMLLAIGAIPMCILSYLLYEECPEEKRVLFFMPSVITGFSFIYWIGIFILGCINSFILH